MGLLMTFWDIEFLRPRRERHGNKIWGKIVNCDATQIFHICLGARFGRGLVLVVLLGFFGRVQVRYFCIFGEL